MMRNHEAHGGRNAWGNPTLWAMHDDAWCTTTTAIILATKKQPRGVLIGWRQWLHWRRWHTHTLNSEMHNPLCVRYGPIFITGDKDSTLLVKVTQIIYLCIVHCKSATVCVFRVPMFTCNSLWCMWQNAVVCSYIYFIFIFVCLLVFCCGLLFICLIANGFSIFDFEGCTAPAILHMHAPTSTRCTLC